MIRSVVFLLFIFGLVSPVFAQRKLETLIFERENLYQQWDYYQGENNAFFGGKSKDDLRNIINTLEEIVSKDNAIIEEVKKQSAFEKRALQYDFEEKSSTLESDLRRYKELSSRQETELKRLKDEQVSIHKEGKFFKDLAGGLNLVLLCSLCIGGIYVYRLKKKHNAMKSGFSNDLGDSLYANSTSGLKATNNSKDISFEEKIAKIERLGKLKEAGLINDEEFDLQKQQIFSEV